MFKLDKREVFGKEDGRKTRPDTRSIPVADGWAGAELRVFTLFDSCSRTDKRTDGRTDQRTDGRAKPHIVACPQLKRKGNPINETSSSVAWEWTGKVI